MQDIGSGPQSGGIRHRITPPKSTKDSHIGHVKENNRQIECEKKWTLIQIPACFHMLKTKSSWGRNIGGDVVGRMRALAYQNLCVAGFEAERSNHTIRAHQTGKIKYWTKIWITIMLFHNVRHVSFESCTKIQLHDVIKTNFRWGPT